ncbi:MAG: hypothetical protein A2498_16120 [Lentisphaerae bacterium RIFOXYC12_FULL_60_16]|nr:MAG: hypothetical protein A2498_16120 [Lentisphaerae bacterium RIFOXYC12_FULL_60_16]
MNAFGAYGQACIHSCVRRIVCGMLLVALVTVVTYAETFYASGSDTNTMVDRQHRFLSRHVLRVAESINNFIAGALGEDENRELDMSRRFYGNMLTAYNVEGSYIRLTPRIILTSGADNEYKVDFSARLRLPDISRRLRLYVDSYDTDYDPMENIFSARYRQALERERGEGATAGLTYFFSDHMKRKLSLSTGVRFNPAPSPKFRLRGRLIKSFDVWQAQFAESVFWNQKDGVGEKTELLFDRLVYDRCHFRAASSAIWSEFSHGVDWGQYVSGYVNFSQRRSGAFKLGLRGYTHPSAVTDQYLIRLTYRQRIYRDWLFLEVEPGLDFFREDDYETTPLINIKIEAVFGSYKRI